jgi:hypothetical protein
MKCGLPRLSKRGFARLWSATVLVALASQLPTLLISPPIWQDEVQIVELGRVSVFDPATDWSLNWLPSGRPATLVSYLGVALQELAFRATHSPLGPRLCSLLGGLVAATALLLWLRLRLASRLLAWFLATAFLFDPIFVAGYRGGRLDGWAIGACLASCLFVRVAARSPSAGSRHTNLLLAGGCLALSGFIWPSALLLAPLPVLELLRPSAAVERSRLGEVAWMLAGTVAAGVALAIPIVPHWSTYARDVAQVSRASLLTQSVGNVFVANLHNLWGVARQSPLVFLLAATSVLARRNWPLAALIGLLLSYELGTFLYHHRITYQLPILFVMIGDGLRVVRASRAPQAPLAIRICAVATLFWAVGLSLGVRTVIAEAEKKGRDPEALVEIAQREVGAGPKRVYLGCWEFYYSGRLLGWHMKRPYVRLTDQERAFFATTVDYAIVGKGDPLDEALRADGLRQVADLTVSGEVSARSFGGHAFGPYSVLARPNAVGL